VLLQISSLTKTFGGLLAVDGVSIGIEAGSHHIWVDHCEFEQVYDGMIDIKGASDFVTISWNVFRAQKKCHLVGASDSAFGDRGHLNVTFHHNWYDRVEERIPRMRFGNAHVFNLYCNQLGGKGIQSTTEAATLVENAYFYQPRASSFPTIEVNGGGTGTVKVVNSVIVNSPGVNVTFRQFGATNFSFNPPFAAPTPPYAYTLDAAPGVPNIVTNNAGIGKIAFELWQMEQFSPAQLDDLNISGRDADPDGDGITNYEEFLAGTLPTNTASALRITGTRLIGNDLLLTWAAAGPRTNIVQTTAFLPSSNFTDISAIPIPDAGDATVSFIDCGALTNVSMRYYRILVAP